jgi:HSP20 family molecular chaperone IbpA
VGLLKRLFGSSDAVEDARERAAEHQDAPAGWNLTSPEIEQTDDEVILRMAAPGLHASSLQHFLHEDTIVLKGHGTTDAGAKVMLNERLKLQGADLSQAKLTYERGQIVVRFPKAAFGRQSNA